MWIFARILQICMKISVRPTYTSVHMSFWLFLYSKIDVRQGRAVPKSSGDCETDEFRIARFCVHAICTGFFLLERTRPKMLPAQIKVSACIKLSVYKKQAVVRGTTNPAPCCHLANDTDFRCKIWRRILARRPRFPITATKFRAYLA